MNEIEAAYVAGILDGEGCFYVERFATANSPIGYQYRIIVTLTMCEKETIDYICSITGKNCHPRHLPSGRIGYKIDWRNSIAGAFIKIILPYLRGKKEQAEWCLKFEETCSPGRGRTYTPEDGVRCEVIRQKLKDLKRPPVTPLLISQS